MKSSRSIISYTLTPSTVAVVRQPGKSSCDNAMDIDILESPRSVFCCARSKVSGQTSGPLYEETVRLSIVCALLVDGYVYLETDEVQFDWQTTPGRFFHGMDIGPIHNGIYMLQRRTIFFKKLALHPNTLLTLWLLLSDSQRFSPSYGTTIQKLALLVSALTSAQAQERFKTG